MRQLGRTGIPVSPIGLGGSQFSGEGRSTFFPALLQDQVDAIVKAALVGGISWFDTAEGYGAGRPERSLAAGLRNAGVSPEDVTVSTKWTPLGRTARSLERTIGDRIANLAHRRGSLCRRSNEALPSIPYRDNSASRRGGTPDTSSSPIPSAAISAARSSARTICGPDTRTGPCRNRSNSDTRAPGGT
ncbi:aldo/keto reductase [Nonomuraea sp. B19D2]|uniref:aldo/keto reductase n=1 Tax=Nonomuraea sp. B19D2 TaxID=3159561 RepID=UPI0032D9D8CA